MDNGTVSVEVAGVDAGPIPVGKIHELLPVLSFLITRTSARERTYTQEGAHIRATCANAARIH